MKLSNIFKKKEKKQEAAIVKVDHKQLAKIIGGADEFSTLTPEELAKVTPKIAKESHGKF